MGIVTSFQLHCTSDGRGGFNDIPKGPEQLAFGLGIGVHASWHWDRSGRLKNVIMTQKPKGGFGIQGLQAIGKSIGVLVLSGATQEGLAFFLLTLR